MKVEWYRKLEGLIPGKVRYNAPLAPLTTFRLGGPAAVLTEPDSIEELSGVLEAVRRQECPLFVLGGGSNVLFRDGGFPGVVLRLGPSFSTISVLRDQDDEILVEAGASCSSSELLALCRKKGWAGLECLAGIPGRVGGALAMNAGAGGQIGDAIWTLEIMEPAGRVVRLSAGEINFTYRRLDLPAGSVILKGVFRLEPDEPARVEARIKELLRLRGGQPRGVLSAGSVFKNPEGRAAGKLIDLAGFKGYGLGQAWVAREHANFIVHRGQARAVQVIELIEIIRNEVKKKFGVELETEIKIVGTDEETE